MVSIIIPSRNERFLQKTVEDVLAKARGDIEIIVVLEGYWPPADEIISDPRVHYLHNGTPQGLRRAVEQAVAIAKGKHILKIDAHCMFGEGYDTILAAGCEPDWVVVPRRYSLDAEKWERKDKTPIDYLYIECPSKDNSGDLRGAEWRDKNGNPRFEKRLIDDLMTFQGSCWFMERDYFYKLGLFDEENYGTFRKEPQEISFNCWLSGGRVVRNKKTWYAHLHKGKQYGRGYRLESGDWNKGDEYNKRWLNNSAWIGQTKDFKWLIDKFNPPGWDKYDWSNYKPLEVKDKKESELKLTKEKKPHLYQNIGDNEGEFLWQNPKKKGSKFWNEGKWENFIQPLLPENVEGQTFVEIGCNAGLFLKLAKEGGFKNVVGVEKDEKTCREGIRYRDLLGLDYSVLNREVGRNFNFDEIPVADVTLLSTVHYYFDIQDWFEYLDKLQYKTRYCLVVSRSIDADQHWTPAGEMGDLRHYFKHWREIGAIADIPARGDPHPRDLWSMMFESDLVRMDIDKVYIKNQRHRTWVKDYKLMYEAKVKLAQELAKSDDVKMEETDYYKRWVERKGKFWKREEIDEFVSGKMRLMLDVKYNGLRDPIIVKSHGQICDGGHRLEMLKALGNKSVIVRMV